MSANLRLLPKMLGNTVRELRREAGWSQMRLAEKAELTLNYVGEIERGEKNASLETTIKIARALGVTGAELLKRTGI